jgi:hypothetical protein
VATLTALLGLLPGLPGGFGVSRVAAAPWTQGGFTTSGTAAPSTVPQGSPVTVTADVTSTAAATVLVDIEIYSAGGTQVFQRAIDRQAFAAGQERTFPVTWTVPAGTAPGVYTVRIGLFSPGWGIVYTWNSNAGQFTVAP